MGPIDLIKNNKAVKVVFLLITAFFTLAILLGIFVFITKPEQPQSVSSTPQQTQQTWDQFN